MKSYLHSLLSVPQPTLAGFDFPIGIPAAYARKVNVAQFAEGLEQFGAGEWSDFYRVCDTDKEISLHRPFYPRVPSKNTKLVHLLKGLGVGAVEMMTGERCKQRLGREGCLPLVLDALGGNQVGKAAISGWRDVVQPARKAGALLWPFDGDLAALSKSGRLVICETYPAEAQA